MANRWWVNDDTDGNWNNANNWSATEGGAGGDGIPTSSDNAFFSATSSNDNCTCSGAAVCLNIYTASADTGGTDNYTGTIDINDQTFGVSGNAQFESACTVNAGNNTWTVAGNMHAETCTFNNDGGTITLTGASKTVKFKNYANTLANLNITGTYSLVAGKYITVADGICTISGTLSGNGELITNSPTGELKITSTGSITCTSLLINSLSKISQMDGTVSVTTFTVLNAHTSGSAIVPATYTASSSINFSIQSSSLALELSSGTYTLNTPTLNINNQGVGVYTIGNNVNNPNFNINGNINFLTPGGGSITWTKGTGTITLSGSSGTQTINFNGKTIEDLVLNCSGATKTIQAAFTTDSYTGTAGLLVDGGYTITVAGNISIANAASQLTSTGQWTVSANANISNPYYANPFNYLYINDSLSIVGTDDVVTKKMYIGNSNVSASANKYFYIRPAANDFFSQHSSSVVSAGIVLWAETPSFTNANDITTTGLIIVKPVTAQDGATTFPNVSCSTLAVYAAANTYKCTFNISGTLSCTTLTLGFASVDRGGVINFSGSGKTIAITGALAQASGCTSTQNAIIPGANTFNLSDGLDLTNIAWTASSETINFIGGNATINPASKTLYNAVINSSGTKSFSGNGTFNQITFSNGTVNSSVSGTQRTITVTNTSVAANTTFKDISMGSANKVNAKAATNTSQGNNLGIVFNDFIE